jgi:HNH endonuclease
VSDRTAATRSLPKLESDPEPETTPAPPWERPGGQVHEGEKVLMDTDDIVTTSADMDRVVATFMRHVEADPDSDCWVWTGFRDRQGYGRYSAFFGRGQRIDFKAHRFAWALCVDGDLSRAERCIDHLCDNPSCVRPDHLRMTTWRENLLRSENTQAGKHARQTHCVRGHRLGGKNLYVWVDRKTGRRMRQCVACRRDRRAEARRNAGFVVVGRR